MKTSIFYYTNNLLPPDLLRNTLKSALDHAIKNDCELIITSHYPLMDGFINELLEENPSYTLTIDPITLKSSKSRLYDHIFTEKALKTDYPHVKNYVVGKLPYCFASIIRQILLSLDRCSGDNIIFMESDVFYPQDYVKVMENKLMDNEMVYCMGATCFLNAHGFYKLLPTIFLSTFSGKRALFKTIFERKLNLATSNKKFVLEPIVDKMNGYEHFLKDDPLTEKSLCLGESDFEGSILDVRHSFNLANVYRVAENNYFSEHKYWGSAQKYIDMISIRNISAQDGKMWGHGLANLDF